MCRLQVQKKTTSRPSISESQGDCISLGSMMRRTTTMVNPFSNPSRMDRFRNWRMVTIISPKADSTISFCLKWPSIFSNFMRIMSQISNRLLSKQKPKALHCPKIPKSTPITVQRDAAVRRSATARLRISRKTIWIRLHHR